MSYDVRYVELERHGHPEAREETVTKLCNEMAKDGFRLAHVVADHIDGHLSGIGTHTDGYTRGVVLFFEKP